MKPLACPHGFAQKISLYDTVQFTSLYFDDPRNLLELLPNKNEQENDKAFESNGLKRNNTTLVFLDIKNTLKKEMKKTLSTTFLSNVEITFSLPKCTNELMP